MEKKKIQKTRDDKTKVKGEIAADVGTLITEAAAQLRIKNAINVTKLAILPRNAK